MLYQYDVAFTITLCRSCACLRINQTKHLSFSEKESRRNALEADPVAHELCNIKDQLLHSSAGNLDVAPPCDNCSVGSRSERESEARPSTIWCSFCQARLCDECAESLHRFGDNRNHKSKFASWNDPVLKEATVPLCAHHQQNIGFLKPEHDGGSPEFYCLSCIIMKSESERLQLVDLNQEYEKTRHSLQEQLEPLVHTIVTIEAKRASSSQFNNNNSSSNIHSYIPDASSSSSASVSAAFEALRGNYDSALSLLGRVEADLLKQVKERTAQLRAQIDFLYARKKHALHRMQEEEKACVEELLRRSSALQLLFQSSAKSLSPIQWIERKGDFEGALLCLSSSVQANYGSENHISTVFDFPLQDDAERVSELLQDMGACHEKVTRWDGISPTSLPYQSKGSLEITLQGQGLDYVTSVTAVAEGGGGEGTMGSAPPQQLAVAGDITWSSHDGHLLKVSFPALPPGLHRLVAHSFAWAQSPPPIFRLHVAVGHLLSYGGEGVCSSEFWRLDAGSHLWQCEDALPPLPLPLPEQLQQQSQQQSLLHRSGDREREKDHPRKEHAAEVGGRAFAAWAVVPPQTLHVVGGVLQGGAGPMTNSAWQLPLSLTGTAPPPTGDNSHQSRTSSSSWHANPVVGSGGAISQPPLLGLSAAAATVVNGQLFILGGWSQEVPSAAVTANGGGGGGAPLLKAGKSACTPRCWRWDPLVRSWDEKPSLLCPRAFCAVAALPMADVPLPTRRGVRDKGSQRATAISANSTLLLVAGGWSGASLLSGVETCLMHVSKVMIWKAGPPLPIPIAGAVAFVLGSRFYVAGGRDSDGPTAAVYSWSGRNLDAWREESRLLSPRYGASVVTWQSRVFVIGGMSRPGTGGRSKMTASYDCEYTDDGITWHLGPKLPGSRVGGFATIVMD
jgi:hypothetical protein